MIPGEILQKVRLIELKTRHIVNNLFGGEYHSAFKGMGMEFAEVREYSPGDDIRAIDWNVTARAGKPFIKKYEEERELTVLLMIDVSASGFFGTGKSLKSDIPDPELVVAPCGYILMALIYSWVLTFLISSLLK